MKTAGVACSGILDFEEDCVIIKLAGGWHTFTYLKIGWDCRGTCMYFKVCVKLCVKGDPYPMSGVLSIAVSI